MDEIILKSHDFDVALKRLKELSEREETDLDFKKVDTSKDIGEWFSDFFTGMGIGTKHMVTGSELNELSNKIQDVVINLNNKDKKNSDEIIEVYNALVAVDKDYIQVFKIQLEGIKEAQECSQKALNDIQKLVEDQRKGLVFLKNFKSKIEAIEHLYDIDNMWDYCQKWQETISILSGSIERMMSCSNENTQDIKNLKETISVAKEQTSDLLNLVNRQIENLETVTAFTNELKKITHLQDIDEMYDSLENAANSLISVNEELDSMKDTVSKQQSDIESLVSFMKKMSEFEHLDDIDDIWNKSKEQQFILTELQSNISSNMKSVEELQKHKNHLKQIKHLDDVDSVWEKTETYAIQLKEIQKQGENTFEIVKSNEKSIKELHKIEHLHDVDEIWMLSSTHSGQLSELEKKNDEINNIIQQNKEAADATISDMIEKNDSFIQTLTKKIKYAYILAGSSFGIAIIELIMILLKVI